MKKIEFFIKNSNKILSDTDDYYFIMNNVVYCDNNEMYESQSAVIGFDDCIQRRDDIGWKTNE